MAIVTSLTVVSCWKNDPEQIIQSKKIDISEFRHDYTNNVALDLVTQDEIVVRKYLIETALDFPKELKILLENKKLIINFLHKQKNSIATQFIQHLKLTVIPSELMYKGTINIKIKVNLKVMQVGKILDSVSLGLILLDNDGNWYSFTDEGNILYGEKQTSDFKVIGSTKSQITAATIDQSNNIYVGDENGDVYFLKKGNKILKINDSSFESKIKNIVIKNNIWYAITEKSIYFGTSNRFVAKILTFSDKREISKTLFVDNNGYWYVGTSKGNIYYGKKDKEKHTLFSDENGITSFAIDDNNYWYASTEAGKLYYGDTKKRRTLIQEFDAEINQIIFDSDNNWYAVLENTIYFGKPSKEGTLIAETNSSFDSLVIDDSNNLMISTSEGEVYFNSQGKMTKMFDLDASEFSKIVCDAENNLYAITNKGIIYFIGY